MHTLEPVLGMLGIEWQRHRIILVHHNINPDSLACFALEQSIDPKLFMTLWRSFQILLEFFNYYSLLTPQANAEIFTNSGLWVVKEASISPETA